MFLLGGSDLGVTKEVDKTTPSEGATIAYTVTVTNRGPNATTGVVVEDVLPSAVSYSSHTGGCYSTNTHLWTVGTLAAYGSRTLTIRVTVQAGTIGTVVTNTAVIAASDGIDAVSANDTASACFVVAPRGTIIQIAQATRAPVLGLSAFDLGTVPPPTPGIPWTVRQRRNRDPISIVSP